MRRSGRTIHRMLVVMLGMELMAAGQTTLNGGRVVWGQWDAGNATATKPAKTRTSLPATCSVGEQFFKTDAGAGQNLHFCTAVNTWTQMTGGGASAPLTFRGP